MTNLTESELKVLKALAYNHYGEGHETWAWATNESKYPSGIKGKALSGVLSSLTQKGLIKPSAVGTQKNEATISTTAAGIAVMIENGWDVQSWD